MYSPDELRPAGSAEADVDGSPTPDGCLQALAHVPAVPFLLAVWARRELAALADAREGPCARHGSKGGGKAPDGSGKAGSSPSQRTADDGGPASALTGTSFLCDLIAGAQPVDR